MYIILNLYTYTSINKLVLYEIIARRVASVRDYV
jgi:hypothetical protein